MSDTKELTLASSLNNLSMIEPFVMEVTSWAKLDEEKSEGLMLVLSEAITNAIEHGNKEDESKLVKVAATLTAEKLSITVTDEGEGFDPSKVDDPLKEENLLKDGGRGIFLMKLYADEVSHQGRGNILNIVFNL